MRSLFIVCCESVIVFTPQPARMSNKFYNQSVCTAYQLIVNFNNNPLMTTIILVLCCVEYTANNIVHMSQFKFKSN